MGAMTVVHYSFTVDDFAAGKPLPAVDLLRPSSCPCCANPARPPGQPPGLIGHGSYQRRVCAPGDDRHVVTIRVPRFLCTSCGATTAVLPSGVYPRRQYSAGAILATLVRVLVGGQSTGAVRQHLLDGAGSGPWRSPFRWRRELFSPLWDWDARQLGFQESPTRDPAEQRLRLSRLLCLHGVGSDSSDLDLAEASIAMFRGRSRVHRVRPGEQSRQSPRGLRGPHPQRLSHSRSLGPGGPLTNYCEPDPSDTGGPCLPKPRGPGQSPAPPFPSRP